MTIVTKGMGAVLKSIKGLKKSKVFPGSGARKQLVKEYVKEQKKNPRGITSETLETDPRMERIYRTQSRRERAALKIKEFRKNRGKFAAVTTTEPGIIQKSRAFKPGSKVVQRGPMAILLGAGKLKKNLRQFKSRIKKEQ
tara:strand:- start:341 stop:760 length:420 start_codon:yes stop_codon:yes gene_type:complete